jgi:hypothetical protein
MDFAELHRLTRRRLKERPADPLAWQENIDELRTDLERGWRSMR